MWNRLRPSTQKILSLAAEVKTLEKDKEHLRMKFSKAEEEGRTKEFGHWVLVELCISLGRNLTRYFNYIVQNSVEENKILDEEAKRLLRQSLEEKNPHVSGGKHSGSSASPKTNKRKSSPEICISIEKKINFTDPALARKHLSPLRYNSST